MKLTAGAYAGAIEQRLQIAREGGAAGHIAAKEASFWGGDQKRIASVANRLGWLDIASRMSERAGDLETFARSVRDAGIRDVVLLGMGGSSLAPEVLGRSLGPARNWPRLHVLDSTDPATILGVRRAIDLTRTLFFVSSKSGTTIEALSLFAYFHQEVASVLPRDAGSRFVAVTDAGTPLEALAREHVFRECFLNDPAIGGRYSALSYFGLAPAAARGVDVRRLLGRAAGMEHVLRDDGGDALELGVALGELALAGRDKATFIIGPPIGAFGLWVEQLIAESTGKEGRGILPVAAEPEGSPLKYGPDRTFVHLRVEGAGAGDESVVGAAAAEGHPTIQLDLEDGYDLGSEFLRWEYAVAVAGRVLGINPFDEPNVQESKDNTARVLDSGGARQSQDSGDLDAGLAELIEGLQPPGYFAITAYIAASDQGEAVFADIRRLVRDSTRAATTLGYGPRFLHSTGQYHKGGPPGGVFLQVTADDTEDLAIPGRDFTFGELKAAQALGDAESLQAHGRRVLRVHLGADIAQGLERLHRSMLRVTAPAAAGRR